MIITGMILEQAVDLEEVFAELTPSGWVVPAWLTELEFELMLIMMDASYVASTCASKEFKK